MGTDPDEKTREECVNCGGILWVDRGVPDFGCTRLPSGKFAHNDLTACVIQLRETIEAHHGGRE